PALERAALHTCGRRGDAICPSARFLRADRRPRHRHRHRRRAPPAYLRALLPRRQVARPPERGHRHWPDNRAPPCVRAGWRDLGRKRRPRPRLDLLHNPAGARHSRDRGLMIWKLYTANSIFQSAVYNFQFLIMEDSTIPFNWLGLLQLVGLWLLVVFAALRVFDLLFPQLRRDDGKPADAPAAPRQPIARLPRRVAPGRAAPTRPTTAAQPQHAPRPAQALWQSNVRMIGVMLLIWAGVSFLPAAL